MVSGAPERCQAEAQRVGHHTQLLEAQEGKGEGCKEGEELGEEGEAGGDVGKGQ